MTRVLAMGLLLILAAPFASAKSKGCTVRVHAQANENDGSVFATPVTTPISGKNIFIEKSPAISEHDVSAYRPYTASDGSFGALLFAEAKGWNMRLKKPRSGGDGACAAAFDATKSAIIIPKAHFMCGCFNNVAKRVKPFINRA